LIELAQKGDFKGVTPRLLPLLIATNRLTDKTITSIIMDMALRIGMPAFLRQQRAILARIDSRPYLSNIKIQTLILCGQNDALTPPDHAQEMADMIKHSQLHIIEGAGHLAPLERPDLINPLLKDWLTR
jgi:pimeloyl-ACP methyl ester carboxylesterase